MSGCTTLGSAPLRTFSATCASRAGSWVRRRLPSSSWRIPSSSSARVGRPIWDSTGPASARNAKLPSVQPSRRNSAFSPLTVPVAAVATSPSRRPTRPCTVRPSALRCRTSIVPLRRFRWKSWSRSTSGICDRRPSTTSRVSCTTASSSEPRAASSATRSPTSSGSASAGSVAAPHSSAPPRRRFADEDEAHAACARVGAQDPDQLAGVDQVEGAGRDQHVGRFLHGRLERRGPVRDDARSVAANGAGFAKPFGSLQVRVGDQDQAAHGGSLQRVIGTPSARCSWKARCSTVTRSAVWKSTGAAALASGSPTSA